MRRLSPRRRMWRAPLALGMVLSAAFTVTVSTQTPAVAAATDTVVDSFATAGSVTSASAGTVSSGSTGSSDGLIGGARRVVMTTTAGGTLTTGTVDGVPDLSFSTPAGSGAAELVYDGSAAPNPIDGTGLGAVDLTDGGADAGVAADAGASLPGVTAQLIVFSGESHCSSVTQTVPLAAAPGTGSQAVFWRYADLTQAPGCSAPADLTQVGAVAVTLDTAAAPGATAVLRDVRTASADYGDLPAAYGLTTAAEGGAAAIVDPALRLGALLAAKTDGVHSANSSADPDDDGVTLTPGVTWAAGSPTNTPAAGGALDVAVQGSGCLSIWLGLNGGTDLGAGGDEVVTGQQVATGTATVRFPLPAGFTLPASVVARARLFPRDLDGSCTAEEPLGGVSDGGEVEDYVFAVTPAPVPPVFTSLPVSPSASQAPTWTFTQPDGAMETCQVTDASGAVVEAAAACNGSFTARLPLTDGSYTLTVVASDAVGRSSGPVTAGYELDTTPPAAPAITAAPANPSNVDQPAWSFTTPDGANTECQVTYGGGAAATVVQDFARCASPDAADLRGRPDGTYVFSVEAVDPAGNISAVATSTILRDTTAPGLPHFSVSPPSVTSSRTPSWSFDVSSDEYAECQVVGSTPPAAFATCGSPFPADLNDLPDGSYTLNVRYVDAAGNTGPTASSTTTLDTTAPMASVLSAPTSPTRTSSLAWTFTAGDPAATLRCSLDAVTATGSTHVSGPTSCSGSISYDVTGRPDGDFRLSVQATDAAGNIGPVATSDVVVDRTAPAAPVLATPATPTRDPQVSWSFSVDPTAVAYCSLSGADATSTPVACTSPSSYDLSQRPDGTYTFSVRAEDQAGNTSATVSSAITLDRTPPGLAITSSPVSPGRSLNPTWSFATDARATPECRLDLGTTNVFPFGPCTSPFPVNLAGDPDGAYTLSVRSRDTAGNVAGPVQSTYVLDTTPPVSPTVLSSPQSPSNNRSPSWTFTSEAGSLQTCRLLSGSADAGGNGVVLLDWQSCAGTFTAPLSKTPDGLLTFQVRAQDAAGNVSVPADSSYVLDTVAAAPVITAAPASPGRATVVNWGFSLAGDEVAQCRLVRGSTVLRVKACASPVVEDLSGLGDGEVDLQIQATDQAGNVSGLTVSSYVLDTTPPAAPVFTDSPTTPGATRSPTWRFTGPADGVTSCRATQDGVALTSWQPCTGSASADLTGLVDGSYSLQARATDNAGNVGAAATSSPYVLITKPPVAPIITVTPGPGGPASTVSWQVTPPSGASVQCRLDDGTVDVSAWAPCSGTVTYPVSGVTDGTLLFSARAVDAVGSIGPTAASAFVLDRTPPATPGVTGGQGRNGANGVVSWSFTTDPGSMTTCEVLGSDGGVVVPWKPCTGTFATDLTPRGSGNYQFLVRAVDTWGNVSVSAQSDYGYDAPTLPAQSQVVSPGTPGVVAGGKPGLAAVHLVLPSVTENLTAPAATRAPGGKQAATPHQPRAPPVATTAPRQPQSAAVRPLPGPPLTIPRVFQAIVAGARDHVALPLVLIVLVLLFLAVQDRLDRGDPKLALAPQAGGNDYAEFR